MEEKILSTIKNQHTILSYEIEDLSERIGLLGDHSIIKYVYNDSTTNKDVEDSMFIKYFPKMEAPAQFASGIGAFKKEMFAYNLFDKFRQNGINLIDHCVPKCYATSNNEFMLLDNLVKENYKTVDKKTMLDYDTVLTVLQSLAKLHACSFIYEEIESEKREETYRLTDEFEEDLQESFFNDKEDFINRKGVDASIKGVLSEINIFEYPETLATGKNFKEVAEKVLYKIYDLVKPSKDYRNVLSHGDLWATNFLIKYGNGKPVDCKFVDFQCARYVPPAQDVMAFIYLTTSPKFREKYMYQVIGMYYNYLEKFLKVAGIKIDNILNFGNFLKSCDEQKMFAVVETAIYFPLILINNEDIEQYFSDSELNKKSLFEDRTHLILAHKDKDVLYRERLKYSITDLKNYCERL